MTYAAANWEPAVSSAGLSGKWRRLLVLPVIVIEFGLALAAALEPRLALVLLGFGLFLVAALIAPVPALILAAPATFAYWRVGPAAAEMSVTDAVTILATLAALPYVAWRNRDLRFLLLLFAFYMGAVAVSVLDDPSSSALAEVGHRVLMVVGPLLIGVAIAALGKVRLALRAYLVMGAVVAAKAITESVTGGFEPAYPFGMHKNAVGSHLASCILILLAASGRLALPRLVRIPLAVLLTAGLLATQSRGAGLALVATAAFYLIRSRDRRVARIAPIVAVLSVIFLLFSITTLSEDVEATDAGARFNSTNSRVEFYEYAITTKFKPDPLFGAGPKWFRVEGTGASPPHNVVIAELSETGIMGFGALVIFLGGVLVTVWRVRNDLGDAAVLITVERVLDAMVGILWVAGTATFPFLIIGMAIGDGGLDEAAEPMATPLSQRR